MRHHSVQVRSLVTTFKVIPPSAKTLEKYGLNMSTWRKLLASQGGVCGVCGRIPPSKRLNVDHEHRPRYSEMPPERRRLFVRGLACSTCNRFRLGRGATPANLRGAADYLDRYLKRRPK